MRGWRPSTRHIATVLRQSVSPTSSSVFLPKPFSSPSPSPSYPLLAPQPISSYSKPSFIHPSPLFPNEQNTSSAEWQNVLTEETISTVQEKTLEKEKLISEVLSVEHTFEEITKCSRRRTPDIKGFQTLRLSWEQHEAAAPLHIWNEVLRIYEYYNLIKELEEVFIRLQLYHSPDKESYRIMFQSATNNKSLSLMESWTQLMSEKKFLLEREEYVSLMKVSAKLGDEAKMLFYYQQLQENISSFQPSLEFYNILTKFYLKQNNLLKVEYWYNEVTKNQLEPDSELLLTRFSAYAKNPVKHLDTLTLLLRQLQSIPTVSNIRVINTLLASMARIGDIKGLKKIWNEMKVTGMTPNAHAYASYIHGCGNAGLQKDAFTAFQQMLAQGLLPDITICNSLLRVLSRNGDFENMKALCLEIVSRGLPLNSFTSHIVLQTLANKKAWRQVVEWFDAMEQCEVDSSEWNFTVLFKAFLRLGDLPSALGRLEHMKVLRQPLSVTHYHLIMTLAVFHQKYHLVNWLYEDLIGQKLIPTGLVKEVLIRSALLDKRFDVFEILNNEMEQQNLTPSKELFDTIIHSLGHNKKIKQMLRHYGMGMRKGRQVSSELFNFVLQQCATSQYYTDMPKLVDEMLLRGPHPDSYTFQCLLLTIQNLQSIFPQPSHIEMIQQRLHNSLIIISQRLGLQIPSSISTTTTTIITHSQLSASTEFDLEEVTNSTQKLRDFAMENSPFVSKNNHEKLSEWDLPVLTQNNKVMDEFEIEERIRGKLDLELQYHLFSKVPLSFRPLRHLPITLFEIKNEMEQENCPINRTKQELFRSIDLDRMIKSSPGDLQQEIREHLFRKQEPIPVTSLIECDESSNNETVIMSQERHFQGQLKKSIFES